MRIIDTPIKKSDILGSCDVVFDDVMVKGVVDVKRELLAIDANLHADVEQFLLSNGSSQEDLWGINLYPEEDDIEDYLEFDSLINIRPRQNNRSRYVEDPTTREKIKEVVKKWLA